ncbi:hypothetical protein V6U90_04985 [Micromonospora sp. CPCC 206060]|uniref:hypothetical protein n=1 Tax=Micromonospora sp. CPCC 206060 TaxID=3122406 RepID=UPI002FF22864
MPTDLVTKTIDALRHLGADNHDARRLLGMYAGRHDMTAEEVAQVLDEFPARRPVNRHTH